MSKSGPFVPLVLAASLAGGCGAGEPPADCEATDVYEAIVVPTTWTTGSTYYVRADPLRVRATLTIQPGAIVKVKAGAEIMVTGTGQILSAGTAQDPVVFTAETDNSRGCKILSTAGEAVRGFWKGVKWLDVDPAAPVSTFTNTEIAYAGKGAPAMDLNGHPVTIASCTFAHNENYALSAHDVDQPLPLKQNVFYDNFRPLEISAAMSILDSDGNLFQKGTTKNDQNGIFVHDEVLGVNTGRDKTVVWGVTSVPFVLPATNPFVVGERNVLEVLGTVVVKSPKDAAGIQFFTNNLHVGGDAVFTSFADDTHGGDTNGDAIRSMPAEGDWTGIWDERFTSMDPKEGSFVKNAAILYAKPHVDAEHDFTFPPPNG